MNFLAENNFDKSVKVLEILVMFLLKLIKNILSNLTNKIIFSIKNHSVDSFKIIKKSKVFVSVKENNSVLIKHTNVYI